MLWSLYLNDRHLASEMLIFLYLNCEDLLCLIYNLQKETIERHVDPIGKDGNKHSDLVSQLMGGQIIKCDGNFKLLRLQQMNV